MRTKPLYHEVSKEILDFIGTSKLPSGGRLPSTRDLATKFGVSHAVVRQALIALEAQGVLQTISGYGAYVSAKFKFGSYGSPEFGSFELVEALALVEAEAAAVAATIISQKTILELEELDQIMSNQSDQDLTDDQADSAFHNLIVRSTKNEVLTLMVESLWEIQISESKFRNAYLEALNTNRKCLNRERSAILLALKDRNAEGARTAMYAYFNCIMEALLAKSEERAYQDVKSKTSKTRSRFLLTTQLF